MNTLVETFNNLLSEANQKKSEIKHKFKIGLQVENTEWNYPIGIIKEQKICGAINPQPCYLVSNMGDDAIPETELKKRKIQYPFIAKSKCPKCQKDLQLQGINRENETVFYICLSCKWSFEYKP